MVVDKVSRISGADEVKRQNSTSESASESKHCREGHLRLGSGVRARFATTCMETLYVKTSEGSVYYRNSQGVYSKGSWAG